jgi:hypothetical protein
MKKRDAVPEKRRASFVEPMLLQRSAKLPEDDAWLIELKLDGFRAIAFKTGGKVHFDQAPAPARHKGFAKTRRTDPAIART